jgi:hypothetical protein
MMSSVHAGNPQVDAARQILCQEIARCMKAKKYSMRVRIAETDGHPEHVSFYSHGGEGWQKESQAINDPVLVNAMNETLEMLASQEHHDGWSARRQSHSDVHDTDFQFHPDKFADHFDKGLESALMGVLFRDHHDSRKDIRRNVRTPRPKRGGS